MIFCTVEGGLHFIYSCCNCNKLNSLHETIQEASQSFNCITHF
uniref:Uncharacterized protein n=1 Tax=Rhizophora mucronata TaxID=61149 RepID=A0A2P2N7C7_RHIMU